MRQQAVVRPRGKKRTRSQGHRVQRTEVFNRQLPTASLSTVYLLWRRPDLEAHAGPLAFQLQTNSSNRQPPNPQLAWRRPDLEADAGLCLCRQALADGAPRQRLAGPAWHTGQRGEGWKGMFAADAAQAQCAGELMAGRTTQVGGELPQPRV